MSKIAKLRMKKEKCISAMEMKNEASLALLSVPNESSVTSVCTSPPVKMAQKCRIKLEPG